MRTPLCALALLACLMLNAKAAEEVAPAGGWQALPTGNEDSVPGYVVFGHWFLGSKWRMPDGNEEQFSYRFFTVYKKSEPRDVAVTSCSLVGVNIVWGARFKDDSQVFPMNIGFRVDEASAARFAVEFANATQSHGFAEGTIYSADLPQELDGDTLVIEHPTFGFEDTISLDGVQALRSSCVAHTASSDQ